MHEVQIVFAERECVRVRDRDSNLDKKFPFKYDTLNVKWIINPFIKG